MKLQAEIQRRVLAAKTAKPQHPRTPHRRISVSPVTNGQDMLEQMMRTIAHDVWQKANRMKLNVDPGYMEYRDHGPPNDESLKAQRFLLSCLERVKPL